MQLIEIPLSPSLSSTLFPFYTKSCWNLEKNKKLYRPCKSFTRSFVLDHFHHPSIHPSIYFFLFDAFHSSPKRSRASMKYSSRWWRRRRKRRRRRDQVKRLSRPAGREEEKRNLSPYRSLVFTKNACASI